jgi:hypothetical protein
MRVVGVKFGVEVTANVSVLQRGFPLPTMPAA